jgi:recombination protein RecR
MNFPSSLIEDAVNELSKFPGIGKKSALRMVLFLLKQDIPIVTKMGESIIKLRKEIQFCERCHNVSDNRVCNICANPKRDPQIVCVVEDLRDVMAIENTHQFNGNYHVLGGLINPIQGIGPNQLKVDSLIERIKLFEIKEVILALSATMEGDTTAFYLSKKITPLGVSISAISRGIAVGGELEYADEITLGRSIANRIPYRN